MAHRTQYRYAKHRLPHDAKAKTLAAAGKSIIQQLGAALGLDNLSIVPDIGVEDGIQAARMVFSACYFDEVGCDPGLKALRRYQREKQQDERSFKKIPKHDWTSHFADGFRMLAVSVQKEVKPKEKPRILQEIEVSTHGTIVLPCLEDLWKTAPIRQERY